MPLQQTSGNVTQDAYGGGAASLPVYVENVFSTYLYTGTGATQSITNNIALSTSGGLVWIKSRTTNDSNFLFNTSQGAGYFTKSNSTSASTYDSDSLTSFNTNGFSLGTGATNAIVNQSGLNFASWTFRKQPKFFDIVTYTGTGSAHTIAHNLGSTPGCIIVKQIDTTGVWAVYHNGLNGGTTPEQYYLWLQSSNSQASDSTYWNNTAPTTTNFTVGTSTDVNASGGSYIAYIFGAGGTGGFGLTGTQDIIKCGTFTNDGSGNATVNLGWEPEYVIIKNYTIASTWITLDEMRGFSLKFDKYLSANTSSTEGTWSSIVYYQPSATGFNVVSSTASASYVYIAIRRGPMATPTTGTSVFNPYVSYLALGSTITTGFPVDLNIVSNNPKSNFTATYAIDRLRGTNTGYSVYLATNLTNSEATNSSRGYGFDNNTGFVDNEYTTNNPSYYPSTNWSFARAPGFFDIVCYTGTGVDFQSVAHNLGVPPTFVIIKSRSSSSTNWLSFISQSSLGSDYYGLRLNTNGANAVNVSTPSFTSTTFTAFSNSALSLPSADNQTGNGTTYIAYLFATCTGVSKVGTYTGNGTGQSIACGFGASGARFVLIKRSDSTGDWYVFDSANGLTSSSSPYLLWDSTAAQTTGNNGVYASSGGFTLGSTASTTTNISSASYIFLAVS